MNEAIKILKERKKELESLLEGNDEDVLHNDNQRKLWHIKQALLFIDDGLTTERPIRLEDRQSFCDFLLSIKNDMQFSKNEFNGYEYDKVTVEIEDLYDDWKKKTAESKTEAVLS